MEPLLKRLLDYYQIDEKKYQELIAPVTTDNFMMNHKFEKMDECVSLIKEAMQKHKKIFIYGDYDADGIMSVSILVKMFSYLKYEVSYHVPNRYTDGYGLTLKRAEEIVENGFDVLITVDNGITAFEGIKYAKEHGLDVLIMDHHQPDETLLPDTEYILHPSLSHYGDIPTSAGYVTFIFSYYFLGYYDQYLATLGAISLVSDMMPLLEYNRSLLKLVISQYASNSFFNISLLKEKDDFNEMTIGMRIAPKINAIGRLIDQDDLLKRTVEFFTSEDKELLLNYNEWINSVNSERKEITKEAVDNSKDIDTDQAAIITVISQKEGVIGLIANMFVKKYNKPTIIFALDQSGDVYKGSCRAPDGFNVVNVFSKLSNYLLTAGGHAMAGGCSVKKENFEAFKKAFIKEAEQYVFTDKDKKAIPLYINEISFENYDLINTFSPFGECWPSPRFKLSRIRRESLMYSRDGQHILTAIGNNAKLSGFYFSRNQMLNYQYIDMIGSLRLSTFFNKTTVEFLINEISESGK